MFYVHRDITIAVAEYVAQKQLVEAGRSFRRLRSADLEGVIVRAVTQQEASLEDADL